MKKTNPKNFQKVTKDKGYTTIQGNKYNVGLRTTDISKILKKQLRKDFPNSKWSITTPKRKLICVALIEYPQPVVYNSVPLDGFVLSYDIRNSKKLFPNGKIMFLRAKEILSSYRRSETDSYRDYNDTNFYYEFSIGKWDKPFKLVPPS